MTMTSLSGGGAAAAAKPRARDSSGSSAAEGDAHDAAAGDSAPARVRSARAAVRRLDMAAAKRHATQRRSGAGWWLACCAGWREGGLQGSNRKNKSAEGVRRACVRRARATAAASAVLPSTVAVRKQSNRRIARVRQRSSRRALGSARQEEAQQRRAFVRRPSWRRS
jgi:hypothetical protein